MSIPCANCGEPAEIHVHDKILVMEGFEVSAPIRVQVCRACDEPFVSGEDYGDWELRAALLLAEKHPKHEARAWLRAVFREHYGKETP